jgi:hypothetical protein
LGESDGITKIQSWRARFGETFANYAGRRLEMVKQLPGNGSLFAETFAAGLEDV